LRQQYTWGLNIFRAISVLALLSLFAVSAYAFGALLYHDAGSSSEKHYLSPAASFRADQDIFPAFCSETDAGKDPYVAGITRLGAMSARDYCKNSLRLIERYCKNGKIHSLEFPCLHQCVAAADSDGSLSAKCN
jgi:hypothetical protein